MGLEYMERLSRQQERLKAQRKRIEMQRGTTRAIKRIRGEEDKTAEGTVKRRRKGWRASEPQKKTADRQSWSHKKCQDSLQNGTEER